MRARTWIAVLLLAHAAPALADPRAYRGPHPIDLDGNWDLSGEMHVHDDLPVGLEPFAEVEGALVFLGDPLAYGWDGAAFVFRGSHPLPPALGHAYCSLPGEHVHAFAPEGAFRQEAGGAYVFTGAMRGGYRLVRPERVAPRGGSIVVADVLPPLGSTFFIGGCLHTVVTGFDGVPIAVPVDGCFPIGRSRVGAPPPPPRRVRTADFAQVQSRPQRAPPRPAERRQR